MILMERSVKELCREAGLERGCESIIGIEAQRHQEAELTAVEGIVWIGQCIERAVEIGQACSGAKGKLQVV